MKIVLKPIATPYLIDLILFPLSGLNALAL